MSDLRVSATEALALMREHGYTYLDVRSPTEFALGRPAGARNIPWQLDPAPGSAQNPQFLQVARREFAVDAKLIVGCHTANRSSLAAATLRQAGYRDVREQRAGMAGVRDAFGGLIEPGWESLGLPIARD